MKSKPQFYVWDSRKVSLPLQSPFHISVSRSIPVFQNNQEKSFGKVNNFVLFMNVSIYRNLFVDMHDIDSCALKGRTIQNVTK